jgi:hypothetical protein
MLFGLQKYILSNIPILPNIIVPRLKLELAILTYPFKSMEV